MKFKWTIRVIVIDIGSSRFTEICHSRNELFLINWRSGAWQRNLFRFTIINHQLFPFISSYTIKSYVHIYELEHHFKNEIISSAQLNYVIKCMSSALVCCPLCDIFNGVYLTIKMTPTLDNRPFKNIRTEPYDFNSRMIMEFIFAVLYVKKDASWKNNSFIKAKFSFHSY